MHRKSTEFSRATNHSKIIFSKAPEKKVNVDSVKEFWCKKLDERMIITDSMTLASDLLCYYSPEAWLQRAPHGSSCLDNQSWIF